METLRVEGKKSFSTVLMIADPHPSVTDELVEIAFASGVDIVELGIPYANPFLDSPVMQASMQRALAHSQDLDFYLDYLAHIRQLFPAQAFEVMIYADTVKQIGMQRLADSLGKSGMDAVLVADYVREPRAFLQQWDACLLQSGVIPIRFVPHPFNPDQMDDLLANSRGFLISQTVANPDGNRIDVLPENREKMDVLRKSGITTPIVAAYGLKTPEHVRQVVAMGADGVLIGTSVLEKAFTSSRADFQSYLLSLREAAG
jgi:tryptophan synthase alpha subunit